MLLNIWLVSCEVFHSSSVYPQILLACIQPDIFAWSVTKSDPIFYVHDACLRQEFVLGDG